MPNTLTLSRTFPYPPEKVFAKYANPDALARWWWPHGFTNEFHSFDFREWWKWVFTMSDGENNYLNEHIFHKIEKNHIIMEHIVEPIFTLEVLFEEINQNETKMTWISTFANAEFLKQMTDFLIEKNNENFDRLGAELQNF
jgi:uncharacterized protein YndB with AHSA1/START domain